MGLKQVFETSQASQADIRDDLQAVLREELDALKSTISQQTSKRFEATQSALETQLTQSQLELAKQQERLRQLRAEREAIEAQRAQLRTELNTTLTQQSQCEAQRSDTMQELATTRDSLTDLKTQLSTTQQMLDRYQSASQSQQHRLNHLYEVTAAQLQTALSDQTVTLQPEANRMLLRVGGHILFRPGQVALRSEGQQTLDDVAAILKTFPSSTIRIEGHTDDRPIKGGGQQMLADQLGAVRLTCRFCRPLFRDSRGGARAHDC